MSDRDKMMNSTWEEFKLETAMVDPFRVQSPKRCINSFVSNAGKRRGEGFMSTRKMFPTYITTSTR